MTKHLTQEELMKRWRCKSRQTLYRRIATMNLKRIGGGRPLYALEDVERVEERFKR